MGITSIRQVLNDTAGDVILQNRENGRIFVIPPGGYRYMDEWIPWCTRASDFGRHHILLRVQQPREYDFLIWQHYDIDGDHVRFTHEGIYRNSKTPPWYAPGRHVPGHHWVNGNRVVVVDGFFEFHYRP